MEEGIIRRYIALMSFTVRLIAVVCAVFALAGQARAAAEDLGAATGVSRIP